MNCISDKFSVLNQDSQIFNRCGVAALSDLSTECWRELFGSLEEVQAGFLSQEAIFRGQSYRRKWPSDALHWWSRIWEYPYVFHHVNRWTQEYKSGERPLVVDVGSGVTFFPFAVAKLGCNVVCIDNDEECNKDILRAINVIPALPGSVSFRRNVEYDIPIEDGLADIVYCISVLEHMGAFERLIEEISRVLKPSGLFVLTIDLDMLGNSGIGIQMHRQLKQQLERSFNQLFPEVSIHPADTLYSNGGPYPLRNPTRTMRLLHSVHRHILGPLIGTNPGPMPQDLHLAVEGFVLTKKQG